MKVVVLAVLAACTRGGDPPRAMQAPTMFGAAGQVSSDRFIGDLSERLAGRLVESRWSSRLIEDFVVQVADTLFEGTGEMQDREANQRISRRAFLAAAHQPARPRCRTRRRPRPGPARSPEPGLAERAVMAAATATSKEFGTGVLLRGGRRSTTRC